MGAFGRGVGRCALAQGCRGRLALRRMGREASEAHKSTLAERVAISARIPWEFTGAATAVVFMALGLWRIGAGKNVLFGVPKPTMTAVSVPSYRRCARRA